VEVTSFKHPSTTELEHDFLWRTTVALPQRGHIGIFNRSYYEEVLVTRVHPEILEAEGVPRSGAGKRKLWKRRYESIVDFERHLSRNGVRIVKLFLHLSKAEQRKRFLARIEEPHKNWKLSLDDIRERRFWNRYMEAYDECLRVTSRKQAPWYVVPADDKPNARLIVSQVLIETMATLNPRFPRLHAGRRRELRAIKRQLRG
jgi:PPK2 family polyphosphate:nucleotide phosphotransferase